jgi:hypothetical protein
MSKIKTILLALIFGLALIAAAPDTAQAAPPPRDVVYTFYDVPLTDADGMIRNYTVSGAVRYTKNGAAYTSCGYGYRNESGSMVPVGGHRVEYAIADTSREGVLAFCTENFATRNTRV